MVGLDPGGETERGDVDVADLLVEEEGMWWEWIRVGLQMPET